MSSSDDYYSSFDDINPSEIPSAKSNLNKLPRA